MTQYNLLKSECLKCDLVFFVVDSDALDAFDLQCPRVGCGGNLHHELNIDECEIDDKPAGEEHPLGCWCDNCICHCGEPKHPGRCKK